MEEHSTLAIVDLGSNSFHLMICRVEGERLTVVDRMRDPVRLRMGLQADGTLSAESQERALECVTRFAQRIRGVDQVRVVGTNTLRRALNIAPFLRKIEEVLGAPVDVIGGREEARLIYLGVASYLPPSDERTLVVDIGGGSTEFIIGVRMDQHVRETRSLGCVSFSMEYFPDNIPTKKRVAQAVMAVAQELEPYRHQLERRHWDRCIGSSGTIKAISQVLVAMGEGALITTEGIAKIHERIKWNQPFHKTSLPGLREDRVPVFLGGLCVLDGIFQILGITSMEASPHSMREGLLLDVLGRAHHTDPRQGTVNRLMDFFSVDRAQVERVRNCAMTLFSQIMGLYFKQRDETRLFLRWAAELHELGLAIAHSGYHKHGAYIVQNGDLDGFSQVEQCRLAFLILNHRKRLKTDPLPFGVEPDWALVLVLRLAVLLNRERIDVAFPEIALSVRKRTIELFLDPLWLEAHPMSGLDLETEQTHWRRIGFTFLINHAGNN